MNKIFLTISECPLSLDDLLEQVKEEIVVDENAIRYCISPEEKHIITLRYVNLFVLITRT